MLRGVTFMLLQSFIANEIPLASDTIKVVARVGADVLIQSGAGIEVPVAFSTERHRSESPDRTDGWVME
jgi:hypothetical protein